MARFTRKTSSITGGPVIVGDYVVPVNSGAMLIGLTVANTSATDITVSVALNDGSVDTHIIYNTLILAGQVLVLSGGDQKIVMNAGDGIKVTVANDEAADVILSIMEMT